MDRALAAGVATSLLLTSSYATGVLPTTYLPPEVELVIVPPADWTAPYPSQVVDAVAWADLVCALGTPRLYRSLKSCTEAQRFGRATGFLFGLVPTSRLLCGVGVCWTCAVSSPRYPQLICSDGPIFDLMTVDLEELAGD